MGRVLDTVRQFFEADDWNFTQLEGKTILTMNFSGDNGQWTCYAQAREEQQQFIFYSVSAAYVPEEKRELVAELLTRANYGMIIGNFEMDYSDGEVRYKTSIDAEGGELPQEFIKHLVYQNLVTMDRYLPGIMALIYSETTPEAEIRRIEGE